MEKPTCGIIQDLLPSYRDGLTGESVTRMLQEHLAECPRCRQRYQEIERQQEMTDSEELLRGKSFGDKLKSIRFYIIGFVIGLALPILGIAIWILFGFLSNYMMLLVT